MTTWYSCTAFTPKYKKYVIVITFDNIMKLGYVSQKDSKRYLSMYDNQYNSYWEDRDNYVWTYIDQEFNSWDNKPTVEPGTRIIIKSCDHILYVEYYPQMLDNNPDITHWIEVPEVSKIVSFPDVRAGICYSNKKYKRLGWTNYQIGGDQETLRLKKKDLLAIDWVEVV